MLWNADGYLFLFFFTSGPPAPYQPQGWGNGYPHWQQGQPDPSEYLLLVGLKLKKLLMIILFV